MFSTGVMLLLSLNNGCSRQEDEDHYPFETGKLYFNPNDMNFGERSA